VKVLERRDNGTARAVILEGREHEMAEQFEAVLDMGHGIIAAANIVTNNGQDCSPEFYNWLTK
jgi:hypothetical protein